MDLTTRYLGLKLKTPLVASSSPLCKEISTIRQLEDGGASAIVLHSLFEEQINLESNELDCFLSVGSDVSAEALEMFPDMTSYNIGPDDYLEHIRKAKAAVKVPIIASLNGISTGGWIRYAKEIQQAGADALELNIYYLPTDVELTGSDGGEGPLRAGNGDQGQHQHPDRSETRSLLQLDRRMSRSNSTNRARTLWSSSTASTSLTSTSSAWK